MAGINHRASLCCRPFSAAAQAGRRYHVDLIGVDTSQWPACPNYPYYSSSAIVSFDLVPRILVQQNGIEYKLEYAYGDYRGFHCVLYAYGGPTVCTGRVSLFCSGDIYGIVDMNFCAVIQTKTIFSGLVFEYQWQTRGVTVIQGDLTTPGVIAIVTALV